MRPSGFGYIIGIDAASNHAKNVLGCLRALLSGKKTVMADADADGITVDLAFGDIDLAACAYAKAKAFNL